MVDGSEGRSHRGRPDVSEARKSLAGNTEVGQQETEPRLLIACGKVDKVVERLWEAWLQESRRAAAIFCHRNAWIPRYRIGRRSVSSSYMLADLIVEPLLRALGKAAEEAIAMLDLWWARAFGRPLSGRMYKIEIQTLFHGNTRDQDQI